MSNVTDAMQKMTSPELPANPPRWELVTSSYSFQTMRLSVPGGWLYVHVVVGSGVPISGQFVPNTEPIAKESQS